MKTQNVVVPARGRAIEFADALESSPKTIYRWHRQGKILEVPDVKGERNTVVFDGASVAAHLRRIGIAAEVEQ